MMVLASWTSHPAKKRPGDVALVVAVILLTMGAVLASVESLVAMVLAAFFLIVAVSPFLFPTRYTITDLDVSETRLWRRKSRRWSDLRRFQVGPDAALVSPFARPNWLDKHRGLVLVFDGGNRDAIVAVIKERIVKDTGETAPTSPELATDSAVPEGDDVQT